MKLALGTAQLGLRYGIANFNGKVDKEEGKSILNYAASVGIDTVDTAIAYGDSEQVLGDIGVEGFKVVTKLPEIPEHIMDIENWVIKSVKDSLSRLGVESLYGLLLHQPNQLFELKGIKILESFTLLKNLGIVKNFGVSVYSPYELDSLFDLYDFDIVQCPLNLVDRRLINSGWLQRLSREGIEIHIRSSFLQGLLLMPRHIIPNKFQAWNMLWDEWDRWLIANNKSPIEACISYALSFPEIGRVVVGVETQSQLEEIIVATKSDSIKEFPDISSDVVELINPSNWSIL